MERPELDIRLFEQRDIETMAAAFAAIGFNKPASQYEKYWQEQTLQKRVVLIAFLKNKFSGYVTICWKSEYAPFLEAGIPEIKDFNVLPKFRRLGIGAQLMNEAEAEIAKVSAIAGIGVGLTPDYGSAQRMYARRGYLPDGLGIYKNGHHLQHGESVIADDDLVLYMTKFFDRRF